MVFPFIAAAIAGSALVGAATSSKAASKAASAERYAADKNAELARETRDIITGQVQPWVRPGAAATNALAARLGLTVGQPTAASPNALSVYSPQYSAPAFSATGGKASGGFAGTSPMEPGVNALADIAGGSVPGGGGVNTAPTASTWDAATRKAELSGMGSAPAAAAPTYAGPDWNGYLTANPDVAAQAAKEGRDPVEYAQAHYAAFGQNEGRDLPMVQPADTAAPATDQPTDPGLPYGVSAADATAPTFAPRPEFTRTAVGSAPAYNFDMASFEASPDYQFRQQEAARALNSFYGARGGLKSGGAIKAILERASNLAAGEYGNWWQRQFQRQQADRGQFNTDNARTDANFVFDSGRSDANYNSDRGFNYGAWYDTRNFNTSRFDKQTSDLFNLSGQGLQGVGTIAGANTNALGVIANSNTNAANATGSAAIASANATNGAIGQGVQALGLYYGLRGGGAGGLTAGNPLVSI